MNPQKTILIAPLDWGLGHATRCMPLIDLLQKQGHRIVIAGNGDSFLLLKENYPSFTFYELPAYNIQYKNGKNAALQTLLQTPKVLKTIQQEYQLTQKIIAKEKINVIISDNRYGVRSNTIKSIFICHQIALQAPKPFGFTNPFFLKMHLQQIHKFDALWIPDVEHENNLSGKLSHGISFKIPHTYIGIQSRFINFSKTTSFIDDLDFSVLIVLSGVEPQRTFLENKLIKKFLNRNEKVLLVQGKTATFTKTENENITIVSYLNTNDLFTALQKAAIIICRSGYSTVMDLAMLGKKAIFIPTKGQTEQEYLAKLLANKGFAIECKQDNLDIENAIEKLKNINGFSLFSKKQVNSSIVLATEIDKQLN